MFTRAHHLSLSPARSIHYISPNPISLSSILILFSDPRLRLPTRRFPSSALANNLYSIPHLPIHAICLAHLILLKLWNTHNKIIFY
jgi:hypothetical protein